MYNVIAYDLSYDTHVHLYNSNYKGEKMNKQETNTEIQSWLNDFNGMIADDKKRQAFLADPIGVMKDSGISVDTRHLNSFAAGLQALALNEEMQHRQNTQSLSSAQLQSRGHSFDDLFHMKTELWGIVMRVDHEAVKQLPKGADAIKKLSEAATEVMRVAGEGGVLGPFIAIGVLYWNVIFTAYTVIMPTIDQGKGVYLTISWPQIMFAVASGGLVAIAALPVPTAVV